MRKLMGGGGGGVEVQKKNSWGSKIPPPPHKFSNGPPLNPIGLRAGVFRPDVWRLIEESERGRA